MEWKNTWNKVVMKAVTARDEMGFIKWIEVGLRNYYGQCWWLVLRRMSNVLPPTLENKMEEEYMDAEEWPLFDDEPDYSGQDSYFDEPEYSEHY